MSIRSWLHGVERVRALAREIDDVLDEIEALVEEVEAERDEAKAEDETPPWMKE